MKPYMLIDLGSGAIRRFELPGETVRFSKDLKQVLCLRSRIQNGRRYKSLVLVRLPTLEEKTILAEDDLPAELVTSQVDLTPIPNITPNHPEYVANSAFDSMLWVKQRIEGDQFHYAIVLSNLHTGKQQVVVPESAMPTIPVVATGETSTTHFVNAFTLDGTGFTYTIETRIYLCDIKSRQSSLLADLKSLQDVFGKIKLNVFRDKTVRSYELSPSGRQVLQYYSVWQDQPAVHLNRFSIIDVFRGGKPVRLYTGRRFVQRALWLDEERIVFYEKDKIFVVNTAGGPPRQIFPP